MAEAESPRITLRLTLREVRRFLRGDEFMIAELRSVLEEALTSEELIHVSDEPRPGNGI